MKDTLIFIVCVCTAFISGEVVSRTENNLQQASKSTGHSDVNESPKQITRQQQTTMPSGRNAETFDNTLGMGDLPSYQNPYPVPFPAPADQPFGLTRLLLMRIPVEKRDMLSMFAEINKNKQAAMPESSENMQMGPNIQRNPDLPDPATFSTPPLDVPPIWPGQLPIPQQPSFGPEFGSDPEPSLLFIPQMPQIYGPPIMPFPVPDLTELHSLSNFLQPKPALDVEPAYGHSLPLPSAFSLNLPLMIPPMFRPPQMHFPYSAPIRRFVPSQPAAWLPQSQVNLLKNWLMRRPIKEPSVRPLIQTFGGPSSFNMFPPQRFPYFPRYGALPNRPFLPPPPIFANNALMLPRIRQPFPHRTMTPPMHFVRMLKR